MDATHRLSRRIGRHERLEIRDDSGELLLTIAPQKRRRHGKPEWKIEHDERTHVEVVRKSIDAP